MVPNGAAYDNFPSFANNGTKTPPGGSTESAKYAFGMVPADTFPAEWANYLFHGATAGITRLNSDTGSIKKEINTVLACKNITPDATSCDQLYCALTKIRDDAVALAWPVGSIYMNAKSATLPASIQAVGTWCAIDGRFLRACASCISCTGGGTATLAVCHLPSHCHATPNHCHSITDHKHSGTVGCHSHATPIHSHSLSGTFTTKNTINTDNTCAKSLSGTLAGTAGRNTEASYGGFRASSGIVTLSGKGYGGYFQDTSSSYTGNYTATISANHRHQIDLSGNTGESSPTTCCTQPSFTGGSMCTAVNTGTAAPTTCNTGSGCAFNVIPAYRDVAMWYRDA